MSISQLNLVVGKILEVVKHPDADSLYVEKIDMGDTEGPQTIVSGLVPFMSPEVMVGRNVILIRNLKPVKMRGVISNALIVCAFNADNSVVEFILPPIDSVPGDKVYCKGQVEEPPKTLELTMFSEIYKDLTRKEDLTVTWKDIPLQTIHGKVKSETLIGALIS